MNGTYSDAFSTYFKWGAIVRHIKTGILGRVVSIADQGSMFVLTAESNTLVGSPRVGVDFIEREEQGR